MNRYALAAVSTLVGLAPATAAPLQFFGKVEIRGGYSSNPRFRVGNDPTGLAGLTIAPSVKFDMGRNSFTLSGVYDSDKYLSRSGSSDTKSVSLRQQADLSSRLSMTSGASYSSSFNPFSASDPANGIEVDGDPLSLGTRSQRLQGDVTFNYRLGGADNLSVAGNISHGSYKRSSGLSGYDVYGSRLAYTRQISDRTRIGATIGATRSQSGDFPTVTSYEPGIVLIQQFSAIWVFSGNIGGSIRRTAALDRTSTGLGFNASLCGTYPLTSVCVTGSRSTAASGFGGARISTNLGVSISHELSPADKVRLNATFTSSKAVNAIVSGGSVQVVQIGTSYDHVLAERISAGLDGRFQTREFSSFSNTRSVTATVHLRYTFKRSG